ncbi:unnamed protein product [Laminaria digitata]
MVRNPRLVHILRRALDRYKYISRPPHGSHHSDVAPRRSGERAGRSDTGIFGNITNELKMRNIQHLLFTAPLLLVTHVQPA